MNLEQRLREGRLLGKLGLSNTDPKIYANLAPDEYRKLKEGIIEGYVESGRLLTALTLIDGTVDAQALLPRITERILQNGRLVLTPEIRELLARNYSPHQIYDLVSKAEVSSERLGEWLNENKKALDKAQTANIRRKIIDKAVKEKNYARACGNCAKIGDQKTIDSLCEKFIAEVSPNDIEKVLDITQNYASKKIVTKLVKEAIRKYLGAVPAVYIRDAIKNRKIKIDTDERKSLIDAIGCEAQSPDELLPRDRILWALAHVDEDPFTAYKIMRKANHFSHNRSRAVYAAITEQHISFDKFDKQDLRGVVKALSCRKAIDLALHLNDKTLALNYCDKYVRKTLAESKKQFTETSHRQFIDAYQLWLELGGDVQNKSFTKIRSKLIEIYDASCRETECDKELDQPSWLCDEDPVAVERTLSIALKADPRTAYRIATRFKKEEQQHKAREAVVKKYEERSCEFFLKANDKEGRKLAERTIAEKYDLPLQRVRAIIKTAFIGS